MKVLVRKLLLDKKHKWNLEVSYFHWNRICSSVHAENDHHLSRTFFHILFFSRGLRAPDSKRGRFAAESLTINNTLFVVGGMIYENNHHWVVGILSWTIVLLVQSMVPHVSKWTRYLKPWFKRVKSSFRRLYGVSGSNRSKLTRWFETRDANFLPRFQFEA